MKEKDHLQAEDEKVGFWSSLKGFLVIAAIVVLLWLSVIWFMPMIYSKPTGVGEAGDMFGPATALFSGLAFAGLISTLLMQRRELELQRSELRLSRTEFKMQRFENALFGQIKLFNEYVQGLTVEKRSVHIQDAMTGRHVLTLISNKCASQLGRNYTTSGNTDQENLVMQFEMQTNSYERLYEKVESDLGPYFRLLFNILRHIENADFLTEDQKQDYAMSVRAHLSVGEIKLLALHCASGLGKRMQDRISKYSMLKYISKKDAEENPELVQHYGRDAFDGRDSIMSLFDKWDAERETA